MNFIHATYVHDHKLQSRTQLDQIRYDQFNVIYLIAYPAWKVESFKFSSPAQIAARFGADHTYPTGESGEALVPDFIDRAQRSGAKVLLCIQDGDFLNLCNDAANRDLFIRCVTDFIKKHNYDGLEIDWENDLDLYLHADLMARFRKSLNGIKGPSGKLYLTTAILPGKKYTPDLASRLVKSVDWVNVMTYDFGGGLYGTVPTHNTDLNRFKKYAANWAVFSSKNLCLGLANYGYRYHGIKPGQTSPTPLKNIGQSFYYNELPPLLADGWRESFDTKAMAPYYFSPDGKDFATIDNAQSLRAKMDWLMPQKYHGVFWWEFSNDFQYAAPGKKAATHPLIDPVESKIRATIR
jgi:chitinase